MNAITFILVCLSLLGIINATYMLDKKFKDEMLHKIHMESTVWILKVALVTTIVALFFNRTELITGF